MAGTVTIERRGEVRLAGGHLWVYRSDVTSADARGGDTVAVLGPRGRLLGHALYSDRSEIALRLIARAAEPADLGVWRRRIEAALRRRAEPPIDATAYRLVHAEGDLLPSLIVDRYGDVLVVQALSQGTDALLPEIVSILIELVGPRGVLARNDAKVRLLEGLERRVDVLHGEVPDSVVVSEAGIEFETDLRTGQKTGLFLDQRENRVAAGARARGRALDAFSYVGGFALHLARRADEVVAVEASEEASRRLPRNAERNGLGNVRVVTDNVFDVLRRAERSGDRFDTIVLDPPSFARTRAALPKALAGYKEINLRALKLLAAGGTLVTSSCSYHVSEEAFAAMLRDAAADARTDVIVVEKRGQSSDHPILLGVPETQYLKCLIVTKIE
ncbi:MAG: rRNA (cytosine1962-C5)-methyltransferase [Candidatus Binatota bacterium]|nr:rRNA (cytosine1962-C5)-methyltransferase [Candidatus Binatota bacterium]